MMTTSVYIIRYSNNNNNGGTTANYNTQHHYYYSIIGINLRLKKCVVRVGGGRREGGEERMIQYENNT